MPFTKPKILEIICPACSQVHKVPADRFRTALSRATTMQCAKCRHRFNLTEQGEKPRAAPKNVPNIKVLVGVLAVIVALLVVVFLSLAARTSGEDSAFAELPAQVQVALFGADEEGIATAPEGLILTMDKGYKLVRRNQSSILVVKGRIRNPGPTVRTRILLEGRVVGADGTIRFVTRSPCGKMFSDKRLKKTKPGKFEKLFTKNKEFINCTLKSGEEKPFQMIFDDIPKEYDEAYTVQVKPLFFGEERADSE